MIRLEGKNICVRCQGTIEWLVRFPQKNGVIVLKLADMNRNVKNYYLMNDKVHYTVEIECPHCNARQFIESVAAIIE